jgi:hypothetical protein
MNSHLNIFNTYSKENREYQLENDLTRAFAICLQEDALFLHEILKHIFGETDLFNRLFEEIDKTVEVEIDVQKNTKSITGFDYLFAVSLSENVLNVEDFWKQSNGKQYDPICDVVVKINEVTIIFEAKRDNIDCTAQLYNQAYNILLQNEIEEKEYREIVKPLDLNWSKLMLIAVKVFNFQKSTSGGSRYLGDFIRLIRNHNFKWLPESQIRLLSPKNEDGIKRRIETAIEELIKDDRYEKLTNRLGLNFDQKWAQEINFHIKNDGSLRAFISPGNTKGQGVSLFAKNPEFNSTVSILGREYDTHQRYHIKFTSFQKYFTGLWFDDKDLETNFYSSENFWKYSGRKKRDSGWNELVDLFDRCFTEQYDWKAQCEWDELVIKSGKNQFDVSFAYDFNIIIPFDVLQELDTQKADILQLTNLLREIYDAYSTKLLK